MERVSCIFMINGAFNFCSAPGHQKVRAGPGLTAGASSIGLRDLSLSVGVLTRRSGSQLVMLRVFSSQMLMQEATQ